ncbi:YjbH domain-containing protein [Roseomonas sp. OT10]|uniref:YjbH domain-containing protein n=1 Tax=Roseomonas cutis TaxID=2897332 RepID=UPI001E309BE5|nr:YjbH domain-containing protein [Roseomonas sp. OT10]UFN47813.1 YjbH domain-containing protein [Roseomonas sp. OT10]
MRRLLLPVLAALAIAVPAVPMPARTGPAGGAAAEEVPATGSDFGGVGLIETRNARFRPDGTLEAGTSLRHQRRFHFLTFQALPFLETTFRLSERLNGTTGAGMTTDRAFDLKLRLLREGAWTPAVAVGLQDLIGTGIYAGEYVVASKRWHGLDVSLGLGWGRLGTGADTNNPLVALSDRFRSRPRDVGRGGTLRTDVFRGDDVSVFGGVEYTIPATDTPLGLLDGLRAKLEWSGDSLRDERGGYPARSEGLRGEARSRINAGLQWSNEWLDAGIHFVHGTDLLFRVSARLDPADPPGPPRPRPPAAASEAPPADEAARAQRVFAALSAAGFRPLAFALDGVEARIAVADGPFRTLPQVMAQVARATDPLLPPAAQILRISWWLGGTEVAAALAPRTILVGAGRGTLSPEEAFAATTLLPAEGLDWPGAARTPVPRLSWGLEPRVSLLLGDPTRTLRWQAAAAAGARVELGGGFALAGAVQQTLAGNLADGPPSDSVLPHVRSDYARYAREGETAIPALYAERIWNLAPDVFGRVTAGLLEPMFGGVSGEVLWRPHDRPWALGLDVNWVRQRGFDQRLAFRDYEVATGHLSLYADLPVWNLYTVLRGGRYLAGDWGGTIELGRRFDSGIEVGGFATFTDVPFSRFGEGSFDKGIYVRIPLDLLGARTRSVAQALIRPVQRDGGQRLSVDNPLWTVTRDGRQDALRRGVAGFAR